MPVYEFRCDECETLFEQVSRVEARAVVSCPKCGALPPIVIQWFSTPPNVMPDMPEYFDRGMGKGVHIRGRKHRREEMRKRGLTEAGDESELKKTKELLAEHEDRKRSRPKER